MCHPMNDLRRRDVTRLLEEWNRGDRTALDDLMPPVHAELHRLARHYLARERPGHTLQPTALINEAPVLEVTAAARAASRACDSSEG